MICDYSDTAHCDHLLVFFGFIHYVYIKISNHSGAYLYQWWYIEIHLLRQIKSLHFLTMLLLLFYKVCLIVCHGNVGHSQHVYPN